MSLLTKVGPHFINMDEILFVRYHFRRRPIHAKEGTQRPFTQYTFVMRGNVHLDVSKEDFEAFAQSPKEVRS